ncbi:MAG: hypothetical protein A2138_26805 [Deltaproteobacteria bacterium RBG_16_71_12]|nr:MAG: hypothetical protein A2138_26805 [Deltaproteobacteria bacterium RBG_16_71_12]
MRALVLALLVGLCAACPVRPAEDTFALRIFEGYRFADDAVLESTDDTADLTLFRNPNLTGIGTLGAAHIGEFCEPDGDVSCPQDRPGTVPDLEPLPDPLRVEDIEALPDFLNAPSEGTFIVLVGADTDDTIHMVRLVEWTNQGASDANWVLTFEVLEAPTLE